VASASSIMSASVIALARQTRLADVARFTSSTEPLVLPGSVTRYRTARLTSSGSIHGSLIGLMARSRGNASSSVGWSRSGQKTAYVASLSTIGVATVVGQITLAVMPSVAVSRATVLTSPIRPHFEAV